MGGDSCYYLFVRYLFIMCVRECLSGNGVDGTAFR